MSKEEYGSDYLYSEDLIHNGDYVEIKLKIEEVIPRNTLKTKAGKIIPHRCLRFVGKQKILVLCAKVNERVLSMVTGESVPEKWVGKEASFGVRIIDSFGDKVPAIRVIPEKGTMLRKSIKDRLGIKATLKG